MGYKSKESLFFVKSQAGDVTFEGERIFFKERDKNRVGGGGEFWEISGRKEDEKRGFGFQGITPRCVEWETGMQQDERATERGARPTIALRLDLEKIRNKRLAVVLYCILQFRVCHEN